MSETYDPGEHTVDEVKEYVGDNPEQTDEVLAAEQAGKNRSTLVEWLETPQAPLDETPAEEYERSVKEAQEAQEELAPPPLWESGLPPALSDIGLVGIRATVSGIYTTPSGTTFNLSPGIGYAVSSEDAQALSDLGVVITEQLQ
jgi:exonuclease VII small subunit